MADFIFNVSKGKFAELAQNVEDNDPAAAVLRLFAIVSTETDAAMRDVATMSALFALTNCAEATNTNYANIAMDETDITITVDNTNDRVDVTVSDQVWTAIAAGDNWTDIVVAYDPDGTDTDTTTVPMSLHDFVVTPNGGNITADFPADAFARAS